MFNVNVYMTNGVQTWCDESLAHRHSVIKAAQQFADGDWGDIDPTDAESNDANVKNGVPFLMGAYNCCDKRIWIILDGSQTVTVLFPEEY